MNKYDDESMDSVGMNKEKLVSVLNDLIFRSIVHGAIAGGLYDSNRDALIASINDALRHFELSDHEVGEVIRYLDYNPWSFPGLIKIKEQRQDTVRISEEDKTTEQNKELEEFAAETLKAMMEGVKSESMTPGALSDLPEDLQAEEETKKQKKIPDAEQLAKAIDWLRSKNTSAEDILDFIEYVCE